MRHDLSERTLAMAGMIQACRLVQQVAHNGICDSDSLASSIESVLRLDADSAQDVFGGLHGVRMGLEFAPRLLAKRASPKELQIMQYLISVIQLERRLIKNPAMLQTLSQGIEQAQAQAEHFHATHTNVLARLADLYSQTISKLTPRIMVQGEPLHLENPDNANKIRALLLAAVRSAVLWRQAGGSRWQVIFGRKRYVDEAERLLKSST